MDSSTGIRDESIRPADDPGVLNKVMEKAPETIPVGHRARLATAHETGDAATIRNLQAVNAALKNDLVEAKAKHATDLKIIEQSLDHAGGGRALAEFRLQKVADLALDLVGHLLYVNEQIEGEMARLSFPQGTQR